LEAADGAAIDALRETKVKVSALEEGEVITVEVPFISPGIRAMIDIMLYHSCYGHKQMFEDRVPPASRLTLANLALKIASEKGNDFFASWKDYRKRHPINNPQAEEADEDVAGLVSELMGDDDVGKKPGQKLLSRHLTLGTACGIISVAFYWAEIPLENPVVLCIFTIFRILKPLLLLLFNSLYHVEATQIACSLLKLRPVMLSSTRGWTRVCLVILNMF
jgi:hypothetical protein